MFNSTNALSRSCLDTELLLNELLIKSESNRCFWLLKLALHKQLYVVHFLFSLIHIINAWTFHDAALVFILVPVLYEPMVLGGYSANTYIRGLHQSFLVGADGLRCLFSGGEAFELMLFDGHVQLLSCAYFI